MLESCETDRQEKRIVQAKTSKVRAMAKAEALHSTCHWRMNGSLHVLFMAAFPLADYIHE
jgi:hypothetical protein